MIIACVSISGKGVTDACLAEAVVSMRAKGLRLAGTVQTNPARADRPNCDMDVHVLPEDMRRISLVRAVCGPRPRNWACRSWPKYR
jgi:hypothetical protein